MWDSLTQEQKWGFQYAAEQMNAYNIAQNNPQLKTNWTAQEVALERLKESANQLWMEVLKRKLSCLLRLSINLQAKPNKQLPKCSMFLM